MPEIKQSQLTRPWMSDEDIKIINEILIEEYEKQNNLNVWEWGCGGSTLFFTERLISKFGESGKFLWISIEHDKDWAAAVESKLSEIKQYYSRSTINIVVYPVKDKRYIEPMYTMGLLGFQNFIDIVLVDGRRRVECLQAIKNNLFLAENRPNGYDIPYLAGGNIKAIILHDANRERYKPGMKLFPEGRIHPGSRQEGTNKPDLWIWRKDD